MLVLHQRMCQISTILKQLKNCKVPGDGLVTAKLLKWVEINPVSLMNLLTHICTATHYVGDKGRALSKEYLGTTVQVIVSSRCLLMKMYLQ